MSVITKTVEIADYNVGKPYSLRLSKRGRVYPTVVEVSQDGMTVMEVYWNDLEDAVEVLREIARVNDLR